ncbi:MAG: ferritin-like domain-containing protein [Goleter apudmare HA4340-LM2]|jgi:rubrerythrin|nr:ferritin-like domain-containing protein [Goleter apudmare HA4340-LM2]
MSNIEKSQIVSPQRRKLIQLGALTGAGGIFALATSTGADARERKNPQNDIQLFNGIAMLEQKAVNTYKAAAENKLLPTKAFLDVALQFAADHAQHHAKIQDVVKRVLKGTPVDTSNAGTFPIPQQVLIGGEAEVLRYALTLEVIASKAYLENIQSKLTTREAINVAATIMPVEAAHAAVYRSVLLVILKEKGLPGDNQLVPYAFLDQQPTPPLPKAGN